MNRIVTAVLVGLLIFAAAGIPLAQERPGSLRGQVLDELGGAIVGATVTAIDAKGTEKTVTTNNNGIYTINGLAPGKYTLRVVNSGFAIYENAEVEVASAKTEEQNIILKVAIEESKVTHLRPEENTSE